jgi:hypothetical protein
MNTELEALKIDDVLGYPVMTKFFKGLLAAVGVAALLFLSIAFVLWELNPQLWSEDARLLFVLAALTFSTLAAVIASEELA